MALLGNPKEQRKTDALAEELRGRVAMMAGGERMPSVRTLMKRYGLSMITVRRALGKLEAEKLVESVQGSGVYVRHDRPAKLVMLHHARQVSVPTQRRYDLYRETILAQGWNFVSEAHEVERQREQINRREPHASAHIVAAELVSRRPDVLRKLARQRVPVVLLDWESRHPAKFDSLNFEQAVYYRAAVEHLRVLGHRNFALLVNEPRSAEIEHRRRVFMEMLAERRLPEGLLIDCGTVHGESSRLKARDGLGKYLDQVRGELPFTALLVLSPSGGLGAFRALHERGIRVPEHCSLVTMGGELEENALCVPALAEIHRDSAEDVRFLADVLRARFSGARAGRYDREPAFTFHAGESTAACPRKRIRVG